MKKFTGQLIYLGPNVGKLGLYYHKGYIDGIEPQLYSWIEKCPALGGLIVPVWRTAEVMRELKFDYAHNMRGTQGKYVTFYREIQRWLATQPNEDRKPKLKLEEKYA